MVGREKNGRNQTETIIIVDTTHKERPYFFRKRPTWNCEASEEEPEEEPEEEFSSNHNLFLSPCFLLVVPLISLYLCCICEGILVDVSTGLTRLHQTQ